MKDNLAGRIVGIETAYRLDPSQVEPGESLDSTCTVWAEVLTDEGNPYVLAKGLHSEKLILAYRENIHTVVPLSHAALSN